MRSRGDDETTVAVRALDPIQVEGDDGATTYTFVITRRGEGDAETTLDWAVSGLGTDPTEPSDFLGDAFPAGTLTFAAGERRKVITVEIAGDLTAEGNEAFVFHIRPEDGAVHVRKAAAEAVILDDDLPVATTLALGEEGEPEPTTRAIGEEGDDDKPVYTTLAVGEEGEVTTQAVGEEGDDDEPVYTTQAVGEEGDVTTLAIGEEGDVTTLAIGEEGEVTTHALGEEGGDPTTASVEDISPFGA